LDIRADNRSAALAAEVDFARHARAARVARVSLRKWSGQAPTGLSDSGRELRLAALLARVRLRKWYFRWATPDSNSA